MGEILYKEFKIKMQMETLGDDLCVMISGGDRPHIGCVSIAEPYVNREGNGSATVSTHNFPTHKDSVVADEVAKTLAADLQRRTVVVCGIHYDDISPKLLSDVQSLTKKLIKDAEKHCE